MGFMAAPSSGGDFRTYLKFDARAGRFFTKPDGGGDQYEVRDMTAIMDLAHIRTGWFNFMEGSAPLKTFDPSLTQAAPKPNPDSKRGFEVLMFSERNIGGLREMCSVAGVVIDSMNRLYDEWAASPEKAAGKLPVVRCNGTTAVKSAKSTNYAPNFEIVKWVDRPAGLPDKGAAAPKPQPAQAEAPASAARTQHAPPPAAKPAPQPAMAGADDVEF